MQRAVFEDVRIEGHLIDSGIMSQVMDAHHRASAASSRSLSFEVGRTNDDAVGRGAARARAPTRSTSTTSSARSRRTAPCRSTPATRSIAPAPMDGVFPDDFYSTTNMETDVRIGGGWVRVANPEMDLGVRVDPSPCAAETVPMADVREGDLFVVGHDGIRVHPQERPRDKQAFEFMSSRGLLGEAEGAGRRRGRAACCATRAPRAAT